MENKRKPFFQVIPVLADVIATSTAYDPDSGLDDEVIGGEDDGPVIDE